MADRRVLDFTSMDQIMLEAERLMDGHFTTGQWTLAQILYHLATAIRLSSHGRPESEAGIGREARRRRFFRTRRIVEGVPTPHARLLPPADANMRAEANALRDAIEQFTKAEGPFPSHPLLGLMSKDEWTQFHCIHCAHHLSFATPLLTSVRG
jgi:hypothetical protein